MKLTPSIWLISCSDWMNKTNFDQLNYVGCESFETRLSSCHSIPFGESVFHSPKLLSCYTWNFAHFFSRFRCWCHRQPPYLETYVILSADNGEELPLSGMRRKLLWGQQQHMRQSKTMQNWFRKFPTLPLLLLVLTCSLQRRTSSSNRHQLGFHFGRMSINLFMHK